MWWRCTKGGYAVGRVFRWFRGRLVKVLGVHTLGKLVMRMER